MTLFRLAGFGLLSAGVLLGLGGCGDKDGDDSSTADDSSTTEDPDIDGDGLTNEEEEELGTDPEDEDTDGDGCDDKDEIDEGHDPLDDSDDCEVFEAVAMFTSFRSAYDGSGLTGYSGLDENGDPFTVDAPWVEIIFASEDYFTAGDDRYTCTWYGDIVPAEGSYLPTDFGEDSLYLGYEVKFILSVVDGADATNCTDMDPELWGEVTPTTVIEATTFGVGWGPMGGEMETALQAAVGATWDADWAPYVSGYYFGFESGGEMSIGEVGYGFNYELDETLTFVYDEEGAGILREMGPDGTLEELPVNTYTYSGGYYGYDPAYLYGG